MTRTVTLERPLDSYYDPAYYRRGLTSHTNTAHFTTTRIADVNGSDRPLFFATPLPSAIRVEEVTLPPQVATPIEEEDEEFGLRDRGVQSAYRESEAQTDPWLPDTVDHRKPRAWYEDEELDSLSKEEKQKRLFEVEVEQWAKRERAIVELQQRRLNAIVDQFQKREDNEAQHRQERVERVLKEREEMRQKKVEEISKKRLKVLRILTEQRRQMTTKKRTKRDIVSEYTNFGSEAYAPLKRNGRADAQCRQNRAVYGKRDISINEDLDLYDELIADYSKIQVKKLATTKSFNRNDKEHEQFLETVERAVKIKNGEIETKKVQPLKIAQRIEKPPPRPPTPETRPSIEDDDKEMAVILLQRLLRGRALQMEMTSYLDSQRQLIRELRTVEALREVEETTESEEEKEAAKNARIKKEKAATSEGQVIGEMLDFLNHQLRRRREERRIDAMLKLAERKRRRLEAEEAGRREEELKRQKMEDEAFRRIMGVNYETTESYLESIINESIEDAAEQLATEKAREDVERITGFTSTASNQSNDAAIVARDLVAAFLFPEVEKDGLRRRLRIEQNKFKRAAQNTVQKLQDE